MISVPDRVSPTKTCSNPQESRLAKVLIQTIVNNVFLRYSIIVQRRYVNLFTAVQMQPEQIIYLYMYLTRCSSVCGKGGTRSGSVDF